IAFLIGLMAGSAVVRIAWNQLRESQYPMYTRFGAVVAVFGVSAVAPVSITLFVIAPAWSMMYLVHPDHAAVLIWPALVFGMVGSPVAGFLMGHRLMRFGSRYWLTVFLALALLTVICLTVGFDRVLVVDTYETFHYVEDVATPLTQSGAFWPVMVTSTLLPMLLAFCLVQVQRHTDLIAEVPLGDVAATSFKDEPRALETL
ncbi:MAG: hypothetical protein AAFV29_12085, partial [Myxococcota bacterium]